MLPIKLTMSANTVTTCCLRQITTTPVLEKHLIKTVRSKGRKIDIDLMDEEVNLPNKPKKPPCPWITFVQEKKGSLLQQMPGVPISQITPIIAREWKSIDQTRYLKEFEQKVAKYKEQLDHYNNSLTDEQLKYLKLKKSLLRDHNAFKELRKTKPLPLFPRNSANLYAAERYKDPVIKRRIEQEGSQAVGKSIFEEYRNLSQVEKDKFSKQQQEDRLRFKQEFDQWYKNICEDGSIRRAVREQADALHQRLKSINYA